MAHYTQILRDLSHEALTRVFAATSRREREACLRRLGVRAAAGAGLLRPEARQEAKMGALKAALARADDEEMAEAVLRAWLLTRRPLLAAALDHLGIPHEDGLTQSDEVSRLAALASEARRELEAALGEVAEAWEVEAYLRFMGAAAAPRAPSA